MCRCRWVRSRLSRGVTTGETTVAIANVAARLLWRLGAVGAAERLAGALRAELDMRRDATDDLWLALTSETPGRFADALRLRLDAGVRGQPERARRPSGKTI